MQKLDIRKELKHYYAASTKKCEIVDLPPFKFLMIDGKIEPGLAPGTSPGFQEATQALYSAAYTIKFMSKLHSENPLDFTVMPLEGLWWVVGGEFNIERKDNWAYTLMILQPDHITEVFFQEGLLQLKKKKGDQPEFSRLRLEEFEEGLCVQILHLGPYNTEPATVDKMNMFAENNGYVMSGKHHEIYLGNPMLAQPEKLKTILRHPITFRKESIHTQTV